MKKAVGYIPSLLLGVFFLICFPTLSKCDEGEKSILNM